MEYTPLLSVNVAGPALPEALSFLLIARLLLILKGHLLIKLKIVALAIFIAYFPIFSNVLLLSYKHSNFRAGNSALCRGLKG